MKHEQNEYVKLNRSWKPFNTALKSIISACVSWMRATSGDFCLTTYVYQSNVILPTMHSLKSIGRLPKYHISWSLERQNIPTACWAEQQRLLSNTCFHYIVALSYIGINNAIELQASHYRKACASSCMLSENRKVFESKKNFNFPHNP